MADLKTTLRELSVLVGVGLKTEGKKEIYSPNDFFSYLDKRLTSEEIKGYVQYRNIQKFDSENLEILKGGYLLSDYIIKKLSIDKINNISWMGFNESKEEPYDVKINEFLFSLKEDSFILENMGLYKLLNLFTGSQYKTRHIFEDYAMEKYKNWFDVTWKKLISYLNINGVWEYKKGNKSSKIYLSGQKTVLEHNNNGVLSNVLLDNDCSLQKFKEITNSTIREQVFSKFINKELGRDLEYITAKKKCSEVASENLANELISNLNYNAGISRFLRFHSKSYYYAKVSNNVCELFYVDSENEISNTIKIDSIVASVPNHQANIITTISNKESNKKLILRNELRFSHGQFNGTPEAKLYIAGGDLLSIYKSV